MRWNFSRFFIDEFFNSLAFYELSRTAFLFDNTKYLRVGGFYRLVYLAGDLLNSRFLIGYLFNRLKRRANNVRASFRLTGECFVQQTHVKVSLFPNGKREKRLCTTTETGNI
jgi:hypothetical protein